MNKICLQLEYGPTPCFRDTGNTVCSLNFCPVSEMLVKKPNVGIFSLLHSHCVMSEYYGQQTDFELGKGEYIATIASRAKIR